MPEVSLVARQKCERKSRNAKEGNTSHTYNQRIHTYIYSSRVWNGLSLFKNDDIDWPRLNATTSKRMKTKKIKLRLHTNIQYLDSLLPTMLCPWLYLGVVDFIGSFQCFIFLVFFSLSFQLLQFLIYTFTLSSLFPIFYEPRGNKYSACTGGTCELCTNTVQASSLRLCTENLTMTGGNGFLDKSYGQPLLRTFLSVLCLRPQIFSHRLQIEPHRHAICPGNI